MSVGGITDVLGDVVKVVAEDTKKWLDDKKAADKKADDKKADDKSSSILDKAAAVAKATVDEAAKQKKQATMEIAMVVIIGYILIKGAR